MAATTGLTIRWAEPGLPWRTTAAIILAWNLAWAVGILATLALNEHELEARLQFAIWGLVAGALGMAATIWLVRRPTPRPARHQP